MSIKIELIVTSCKACPFVIALEDDCRGGLDYSCEKDRTLVIRNENVIHEDCPYMKTKGGGK